MALLDSSFSNLRRILGLRDTAQQYYNFGNTPGIGRDYLNSAEGQNPLYELYASAINGPGSNIVRRNSNRIENLYKTAAAHDVNLTRDKFLESFDVDRFASGLTPFERGERPGAYQGTYKLLKG